MMSKIVTQTSTDHPFQKLCLCTWLIFKLLITVVAEGKYWLLKMCHLYMLKANRELIKVLFYLRMINAVDITRVSLLLFLQYRVLKYYLCIIIMSDLMQYKFVTITNLIKSFWITKSFFICVHMPSLVLIKPNIRSYINQP